MKRLYIKNKEKGKIQTYREGKLKGENKSEKDALKYIEKAGESFTREYSELRKLFINESNEAILLKKLEEKGIENLLGKKFDY